MTGLFRSVSFKSKRRYKMMTTIHIKVDTRLKKSFDDKASRLGKPSDMLRSMMKAFIEDRITITPTPEQLDLFTYKEIQND